LLERAQITDRANPNAFIDEYVENLTAEERGSIIEARDGFLIKLEQFSPTTAGKDLVRAPSRKRTSNSEQYLFDFGIPVLIEENHMRITANVLVRSGGFRHRILDALGVIETDRKIEFRVSNPPAATELLKWKVKNDDSSPHPRGEITDHHTLNDPEHSKYKGNHFVECYAIRRGVCIARSRQAVTLKSG
jgi:hypothetical protein